MSLCNRLPFTYIESIVQCIVINFFVVIYIHDKHICSAVAPEITVVPPHITVLAGSNVTITCTAVGNPKPSEVKWEPSNILHLESYQETVESLSSSTVMNTLLLGSVTPTFAGEYHCSSRNDIGIVRKSVTVIVHGK